MLRLLLLAAGKPIKLIAQFEIGYSTHETFLLSVATLFTQARRSPPAGPKGYLLYESTTDGI